MARNPLVSRRDLRDLAHGETVLVVGLGRFGSSLACELAEAGVEVLGIDTDEEIVQEHSGLLTHVVRADATKLELLRQLSVEEFRFAVVAIGTHLESSILVASQLLRLGVESIWAKAISDAHGQILDQLGVHHVVYPEHEMGRRVAHLLSGSVSDYVDLGTGFAMVTATVPPAVVGHRLDESDILRRHGVQIVARRAGEGDWEHTSGATVPSWDDVVVALGPEDALHRFGDLT